MKIILCFLGLILIIGCKDKSSDLETIKKGQIPNSHLTWGEAASLFSHCVEESKKWDFFKFKASDINITRAEFSCDLNSESHNIYNSAKSMKYTLHITLDKKDNTGMDIIGLEQLTYSLNGVEKKASNICIALVDTCYISENKNPVYMISEANK